MAKEKISNFITVFDTTIQEKSSIDTSEKVDQALTELLTAIKDLRECSDAESIDVDQNRLIKYGEFLINLPDKFDFSEEKHKEEIISNSLLPANTPYPEEFWKYINKCSSKLKIFEYKLIYTYSREWLMLGGSFEEWLEKSFTKYSYFALSIKLTRVISDYFDLLNEKLNITIPSEAKIRHTNGLILHNVLAVKSIKLPIWLIANKEVNYSIEEYRNKVTSLLNYGISLDISNITNVEQLVGEMFGVSDSICKYIY